MAEFSDQQREILDDALAAFKQGYGDGVSLGDDFTAAFEDHYGGILKEHEDDIVAARKGDSASWQAALQAVRDTGAKAAEKAREGAASGTAEISADHFDAAWAEVESQKLGSNWCSAAGDTTVG